MTTAVLAEIRDFEWDRGLVAAAVALKRSAVACYRVPLPAVVAGRGSRLEREIRLENVSEDGVSLFRRSGGGCSVFLDPGCAIVSAVYPEKGFGNIGRQFERCTQWLIKGLEAIGITGVYRDGISDLVMDHAKVGGSCLKRSKDLVYFSAVLPVSCDLERMDRYLCHPPREPAYRQGRSHTQFVRNLETVSRFLTVEDVVDGLNQYLDPDIQP